MLDLCHSCKRFVVDVPFDPAPPNKKPCIAEQLAYSASEMIRQVAPVKLGIVYCDNYEPKKGGRKRERDDATLVRPDDGVKRTGGVGDVRPVHGETRSRDGGGLS